MMSRGFIDSYEKKNNSVNVIKIKWEVVVHIDAVILKKVEENKFFYTLCSYTIFNNSAIMVLKTEIIFEITLSDKRYYF
jgi:hypothetical protein